MVFRYLFQRKYSDYQMDDSGWKFFQTNDQSFIVRRCFSTTNFKLLLSDHRRFWGTEGTAGELIQMSRIENPLCEFDHLKVTKNIFNLFDKSLNLLTVDSGSKNSRILKMSSSLGNRPFSLVWTLIEEGPDELFKEVTCPLLYCIGEMSKRQEYLCQLLIEKDKEINEHVLENGALKWAKIKTEKFNDEEFRSESLFLCQKDQDPIMTVWTEGGTMGIFNKYVQEEKKEDHDESNIPKASKLVVKQEEIASEAASEVEVRSESTKVKEEKVDKPSNSKPSQTKWKKVKLNL